MAGDAYFPFGRFAGGVVTIANTNNATQIDWYSAPTVSATPLPVFADGSAVTTAVTVGVMPVPDACFAAAYVYPVLVGASTMAMTVSLKG